MLNFSNTRTLLGLELKVHGLGLELGPGLSGLDTLLLNF